MFVDAGHRVLTAEKEGREIPGKPCHGGIGEAELPKFEASELDERIFTGTYPPPGELSSEAFKPPAE